jgi:hypothetical protein
VDQQRAESASSISVGTLRAIAIDHLDSTGSGPLRRSNPIISALAGRATPTPVPAAQGHGKHALVGLAVGLAVVCAGLLLQLARTPSGAHQAASASFGPLPAESFAHPSSPPASVSAVPPPPSSAQAAATAEPDSEANDDGSKRKRPLHEHKAVHGVRLPAAGIATAPVAAPASNSASAASIATAPASQPANTFGRGAFGGRH